MHPPVLAATARIVAWVAVSLMIVVGQVVTGPASAAGPPAPGEFEPTPEPDPVREMCGAAPEGYARCLSVMRTDGTTLSAADPAGHSPADLRDAYTLPSDSAGVGVTVAVVAAFDNPNAEADLAVYREQFGLPPCTSDNGCFRKVDERGGTNYPRPHPGWAGEISLDVQMVSAVCPQCDILLVEGDDNSFTSLGNAVNTAVRLGADYVSNSYGTRGEFPGQTQYAHYYDHPGVVITVSSGDSGYGMSFPASSPHVTAVGGTSLVRADNARGWAETTWSGAGSGCSGFAAKPEFQTDPACPTRTVADVSAVADPRTGVAVYHSYEGPGWAVFGGTSASAPIIAATYALAGQPAAGTYPNSYPYATPAGLNDITDGANGSCAGSYLCTAGPGYDGPTGLGSPAGTLAFAAPGAQGTVEGTVTDAATGEPVPDARVSAGAATVTSDDQGHFQMTLPVGSYDMSAEAFGYESSSVPDVLVGADQTVRQDFTLTAVPMVTVNGAVTDGSGHGWPLRATVEVDGVPTGPVHTDPFTGRYSVELPANAEYTLRARSRSPGYQEVTRSVPVGESDTSVDVALPIVAESCTAPGYGWAVTGAESTFDGTSVPEGWTVVDATGNGSWAFDDPAGRGNRTGGDGGFATFDARALPNFVEFDSTLLTPVADLSDVTAPVLTFDTIYRGSGNSTGNVDISVDGGQTWTTVWHHEGNGATGKERIELPQAAGQPDVQARFHYTTLNSGWWQVDTVILGLRHCDPIPGGLVAGYVVDGNTGEHLNGALVSSDGRSAEQATTAATPDDPALDDGFYRMFSSLSGSQSFTATLGAYTPATADVSVAPHWVTRADFTLGAGHLVVDPANVSASKRMGRDATRRVTVTNDGTASVTVSLYENNRGTTPLATTAGPTAQRIAAELSLGPAQAAQPVGADSQDAVPQAPPWTSVANYPTFVMDNAMATGDDGTVYSVGGWDGGRTLNRGYAYDPRERAWQPIGAMAVARSQAGAAFLNGMLYVVGGWAVNGLPVPEMEVYNPGSDVWTTASAIPEAHAAAAVAVLDGDMYVVGGCGYQTCGDDDVFVYDTGTDQWRRLAAYPEPISHASCGGIGGRLYCAGGATDTGTSQNAYVYDPAHDAWSPLPDLPMDLFGSAYTAANGMLLISGGATAGGSVVTNEGVGYDPARGEWVRIPNANQATFRSGSTCGFYRVGGSVGGFRPTARGELLPGYAECGASAEVAWLSVDETEFTLEPGDSTRLRLTLDAGVSEISQPGTYTARIGLDNDSPYATAIDVAYEITPPKRWGKVTGTVVGVRCDGSRVPLAGATVEIVTWTASFTLRTDGDGRYALWLDRRHNPLTILAAKDGWSPWFERVRVRAGRTTTVDFALGTTAPCG